MTIDVIIPAHNASGTIGRALASLAAQTDKDFRAFVVDDRSDDEEREATIGVIQAYRDCGLDISFVLDAENHGPGMARQIGIDYTDGEWIAFLDADDVLMPYAIEAFKVIVGNNPDMNVLHSAYYKQVKRGGKIELIEIKRGWTWMHGKLYRRAFLEEYGIRNDERFSRWADDSYFNAMCSELTPMVVNELPMYVYTDTADSLTNKDENAGRDKLIILMQAMYEAAGHTLRYKETVGHLWNTLRNIDNCVENSGVPMNDEEKEAYDKLTALYAEHGVKPVAASPEEPKRRFICRGKAHRR